MDFIVHSTMRELIPNNQADDIFNYFIKDYISPPIENESSRDREKDSFLRTKNSC